MNDTITIRTFQADDLPALVDLINTTDATDHEDASTTINTLRERFYRPYFYVEDNCFVAVTDTGRIVGYVIADLDPRFGRGWGTGCVHPEFRRQGLGTRLLTTADKRHHARADNGELFQPHLGLYVTRHTRDTIPGTMALFEAQGYEIVRVSWIMHIDFDANDPLTAPPLPDGFTLRPVDPDPDAPYGGRAILAAEADIFKHNWGYNAPPFEVWQELYMGVGYDPALWLIAVDAEERIAGMCLCRPKGPDTPNMGWVELLGVRDNARGRGLGSALLRQGFALLQNAGYTATELDVDSENEDNAVALYERAGMHHTRRYLIYGKRLRDGQP
jgi:mycothiol synthase